MSAPPRDRLADRGAVGTRAALTGVLANALLAVVKVVTGVLGHSYALVADGIESATDIFSSLVVMGGVRIAARPPDEDHPYGHGKAEPLATVVVAIALFGAALAIGLESVREIRTPHHAPAPFTLLVLVLVVVVKEGLFRRILWTGKEIESGAVAADAWHHRSDALTSGAAAVGITASLLLGPGYEAADDWAALLACLVIAWNGVSLLRPALAEIMDAAAPPQVEARARAAAGGVAGVLEVETCRLRKSGLGWLADVHVIVDRDLPVWRGHEIAHAVKDALLGAKDLHVLDALVHVEPSAPAPDLTSG